jgi:hypothetical protein
MAVISRGPRVGPALLLALAALSGPLPAQDARPGFRILPGAGVEYFTRTVAWDQDLRESGLKSVLAILRGEFRPGGGFEFGLFAGYGLSNPNGLVFRGLPFSLDYEAGSIGAVLLGADLRKTVLTIGDYEIGLLGRYARSLASTADLTVASLNRPGQASGRNTWQRAAGGPFVRYLGYERFSPYLSVTFDKLWGEFTMTETIGDLTGEEVKAYSGKGIIGFNLGTIYEPAAGFRLSAELAAIPYKKLAGGWDVDYGITLRAVLGI